MKKKWVIIDENAHWWKRSKEVKKWVIKQGDDYWVVNGSEFPEKKLTKKEMFASNRGGSERSVPFRIKWSLLILLTCSLAVSIATIIFLLLGI